MKKRLAFFTALLVLLSACALPFRQACIDAAVNPNGVFKYTQRKADVACNSKEIYKYAQPHLILHDAAKDEWTLNPSGVLTEDFRAVVKDQLGSLNDFLSYKNRSTAGWVDWTDGFRPGLEKEEAILLEIMRRLNYVGAYNTFTDAVGELPKEMQAKEYSYFFPAGRKFYSMRVLYPPKPIESISFTAEYLEVAKREGTLKLVDTLDVASSQEFAKKNVNIYDPNDFSWEKQERGWRVLSYKVVSGSDKPADNSVHYIEIYRKTKDLSGIESRPAVRGFLAVGGQFVSVFVIDYDKEGSSGYNNPDETIRTSDVTTGNDIFADATLREKLLTSLYDFSQTNPAEKTERKKPKDRIIYTEIVKLGGAKIDLWERGAWSVPFDYKSLSPNLEIKYRKPESTEELRIEEKEKLKRIELFIREFKQNGKKVVIEYWAPKSDYSELNIAESFALSATISIRRKGFAKEEADVEHFAKLRKAIEYSSGGKWFQIVDEDGDGTFEKKREISEPVSNGTVSDPNYGYGGR